MRLRTMQDYKINSMFHWYPLIEPHVPTPRTMMIPYDIWEHLDDDFNLDECARTELKDLITKAVMLVGGYPSFIRTDQGSNKHAWKDSCYLDVGTATIRRVYSLIEWTIGADLPMDGFAVREFLDLEAPFTAFADMPIAREYRFFAEDGELKCWHPYWPEGAIWRPSCEGWREILRELSAPTDDFHEAEVIAIEASRHVAGEWSIDVCRTETGEWFLTDMALAWMSYHDPVCPRSRGAALS